MAGVAVSTVPRKGFSSQSSAQCCCPCWRAVRAPAQPHARHPLKLRCPPEPFNHSGMLDALEAANATSLVPGLADALSNSSTANAITGGPVELSAQLYSLAAAMATGVDTLRDNFEQVPALLLLWWVVCTLSTCACVGVSIMRPDFAGCGAADEDVLGRPSAVMEGRLAVHQASWRMRRPTNVAPTPNIRCAHLE